MLDTADENDLAMKAEVFRELGEFEAAMGVADESSKGIPKSSAKFAICVSAKTLASDNCGSTHKPTAESGAARGGSSLAKSCR